MDRNAYGVAIGASAGGVDALLEIARTLPPHFPAYVLVTQHVGTLPSILPELMRSRGPNHAMHPRDGDTPIPGTIYVAPPDHHLLFEKTKLRLFRGPKENHCRPAIDPMFRSVAMTFRSHAIGVVLTGNLDDGTAGLKAIKQCGGTAIVQDPSTATEPSMPASALANVEVDYALRVDEIVPQILRIAEGRRARAAGNVPDVVQREDRVLHGSQPVENLHAIAKPSSLTCPDCGGGLWELNETKPLRYRCHTGHAFSERTLRHAQMETTEHALWSGVRSLQEKEILLRRVAAAVRATGDNAQAKSAETQADRARAQAKELVKMIEERESGSA